MENSFSAAEGERTWHPYEGGKTVGRKGPAGGRIREDEEYGDPDDAEDVDARITWEAVSDELFAVTANLYGGWLQETATLPEEAARAAYALAKEELPRLAEQIPDEEDRDMAAQVEALNRAVATFTARFGGQPTY